MNDARKYQELLTLIINNSEVADQIANVPHLPEYLREPLIHHQDFNVKIHFSHRQDLTLAEADVLLQENYTKDEENNNKQRALLLGVIKNHKASQDLIIYLLEKHWEQALDREEISHIIIKKIIEQGEVPSQWLGQISKVLDYGRRLFLNPTCDKFVAYLYKENLLTVNLVIGRVLRQKFSDNSLYLISLLNDEELTKQLIQRSYARPPVLVANLYLQGCRETPVINDLLYAEIADRFKQQIPFIKLDQINYQDRLLTLTSKQIIAEWEKGHKITPWWKEPYSPIDKALKNTSADSIS